MSVSMKPSTFAEGGGLIDDCNVEIVGAKFGTSDYGGHSDAVPVAIVTYKSDEFGESEQIYSVGDSKSYAPSRDGKSLEALGTRTSLTKTSKFGMLMASMVESGVAESDMGDDITWMVGVKGHVIRKAVAYKGLKDSKESSVLVFDRIDGNGATNTKSAPAVDDDTVAEASQILAELVSEAGGSLPVSKIILGLAKNDTFKASANQKAVKKLIISQEFLNSNALWEINGGVITV